MAVYRRPDRDNEWWITLTLDDRRIRRRATVQTKRGAEQEERAIRAAFVNDLERGRDPFAGPPPTLAEFADRWMREYVLPRARPSGVRAKEKSLRVHILPAFGRLRLDKIATGHVDAFIAAMSDGRRSPKTVNNTLSVLHACLKGAAERRLIAALPTFHWMRCPRPSVRFLTPDEEAALLAATRPGLWRTLVLLILHTGLRFSEAAALTWDDLELDAPTPLLHVRRGGAEGRLGPTKTGRVRTVPLSRVIAAELARYPRVADFVFPAPKDEILNPGVTHKNLKQLCERAGIRPCGWHALRHTYATRLVMSGVPLPVVQKLLGHTTIEMTLRYVHADSPDVLATADVVNRRPVPWGFGHQAGTKAPNRDVAPVETSRAA